MGEPNYNALFQGPSMADSVWQGFERGKKMREESDTRRAIQGAMAGDQRSLNALMQLNPSVGMALEDQLSQRAERQRADAFRTAAGNMLVKGAGGQTSNALVGSMVGSQPSPPVGAAQAPSPSARDPQAALQLLEPHKDSLIKGADIIRRINPTDQAGWDAVRAEAVNAGIDLTEIPERFIPQYSAAILRIADHYSSETPEAPSAVGGTITVTGQRSPTVSPDFEAAARADPEKFLTFQGKQTEITKGQLQVAQAVNDGVMQLLGGVHDQASYEAAIEASRALYGRFQQDFSAVERGLPPEYSPEMVRDLQMRGMDTAKQLQQVVRENRLEADIADDEADNSRADRNTGSMINYRQQRIRQGDKPKPGRTPPAPKGPTPNTVVGRIMDKQARGETLTPAERQTLTEYRAPRSRVSISPKEAVAVGPKGEKLVVRGGKWVNAATGKPVQ